MLLIERMGTFPEYESLSSWHTLSPARTYARAHTPIYHCSCFYTFSIFLPSQSQKALREKNSFSVNKVTVTSPQKMLIGQVHITPVGVSLTDDVSSPLIFIFLWAVQLAHHSGNPATLHAPGSSKDCQVTWACWSEGDRRGHNPVSRRLDMLRDWDSKHLLPQILQIVPDRTGNHDYLQTSPCGHCPMRDVLKEMDESIRWWFFDPFPVDEWVFSNKPLALSSILSPGRTSGRTVCILEARGMEDSCVIVLHPASAHGVKVNLIPGCCGSRKQ